MNYASILKTRIMKKIIPLLYLFLAGISIQAQNTIKGTVLDEQSQPIPFVNVMIMSVENGNIITGVNSDFDGKFEIKNISQARVKFYVSSVEFEPYEKNIEFKKDSLVELTITLKNGARLEEVVVTSHKAHKIKASRDMVAPQGFDSYYSNGNNTGSLGYYNSNFNTESYEHIESNSYKSVKKEPLSTLSIDVDRASYSNVRRFINDGQMPPSDAVRIEEMINYFSYSYEAPYGNTPLKVTTTYTTCPWNKEHNLLHVGLKSMEIDMKEAPTNNLVFLLDVSGSMDDPDKLPLLKKGLSLLVNEMRPNDKIAIVVYAGAAGVVLKPTSGKNKEQILEALENLEAGGSTAGGEGIKLAYKLAKDNFVSNGNNRVILATVGVF